MSAAKGIGRLEADDHPRARLTTAVVAELRRRVGAGATIEAVAACSGVAWTTAYKAVTGLTWRSIDDPPPVASKRRRWRDDEVQYLAEHLDDLSSDVAAALGRSPGAVRIKRHREEL